MLTETRTLRCCFAHRVPSVRGSEARVHGHTVQVSVQLFGAFDRGDGVDGDALDRALQGVITEFDHCYLAGPGESEALLDTLRQLCGSDAVVVLPGEPTHAALALAVFDRLAEVTKPLGAITDLVVLREQDWTATAERGGMGPVLGVHAGPAEDPRRRRAEKDAARADAAAAAASPPANTESTPDPPCGT